VLRQDALKARGKLPRGKQRLIVGNTMVNSHRDVSCGELNVFLILLLGLSVKRYWRIGV
jgi:hypothetical protein